jgi:hypothetical protein
LLIVKHIVIFIALAVSPAIAVAKYYIVKRQSEAAVYLYGGLSALQYSPQSGTRHTKLGGGGGASYTYYFNDYWGLVVGFEAGTFGASVNSNLLLSGRHEQYTDNIRPREMILNGRYENYEEKQSAVYGHIPLMAQLLIPARKHNFYLAAGIKFGIALSSSFQTTFDKVTISAYIPFADQTIEEMPQLGFVTRTNTAQMYDVNGKVPLGINLSGAVEGGLRWTLEDGAALYTGIYVDYGILNVQKQRDLSLITGTERAGAFAYHSILESKYEQQAAHPSLYELSPVVSTRYIDRVNLAAVGIKIKLAFNASGIPIITRTVRCGCPSDKYR